MLLGCEVDDLSGPFGDNPGVKREIGSRVIDPEWLIALDADLNTQFFAKFSTYRVCRRFASVGMASRDVPDIRIPTSVWMTVAQKYPIRVHQHGCRNEVAAVHPSSLARPSWKACRPSLTSAHINGHLHPVDRS